jgi:hypothetical protein
VISTNEAFASLIWNAGAIVLMAEIHFETKRQKYHMSSKHWNRFL